MTEQIDVIRNAFENHFGYKPEQFFQAPGRVNLIGEHTDYNQGFVLPCAINYQAVIAGAKRKDKKVRILSLDYGNDTDEFSLDAKIDFVQDKMWANYIRGVVNCLIERGYAISGLDMAITGNVPQGAGLSSSAALEVAVAQTFNTLFNLKISAQDIALIAQQAENEFVGCNCGIMDQLISAKGQQDHALLIDCRDLQLKPVKLPDNIAVIIVNSNKQRGLVESEYNLRRAQCDQAAKAFSVASLRDVTLHQFELQKSKLDEITAKRARHVITENVRTLAAAEALIAGNMPVLARLMAESHASMRDDFAITVPEIDALVTMIKEQVGQEGGVRMTGGGFGGCVVALVPIHLVDKVVDTVKSRYQDKTGLKEQIFICRAANGASAFIH